jgi:uncharacterized protein (TIGR04255 family)
LARFYEKVKDRFGIKQELDTNKVPIDVTPHQPRYQFRNGGPEGWPLLQFGPGIATLNFVEPYTWNDFREAALYLRPRLVDAYEEELEVEIISLRYRNAVPCKYSSSNLLSFLKKYLNISIQMPAHIPGEASKVKRSSELNFAIVYDLDVPSGKGIVRVATGTKRVEDKTTSEPVDAEHIIFELEVVSKEREAPSLKAEHDFEEWLTATHSIIHDWFFSLIEGSLRSRYEGGEE